MKNNSLKQISYQIKVNKHRIIGISGIPGAGKSTISMQLAKLIPQSIVLSMDGFHIYRKDLNQQGIQRRGAPFTFNYQRFKQKMMEIYNRSSQVKFPIFNHEEKDPIEDAIIIKKDIECIIVQGLYIFDQLLNLDKIWDLRLWIQIQSQQATKRLIQRHVQTGVTPNKEQAIKRANGSDYINSKYVMQKCKRQNIEYKIINNQ